MGLSRARWADENDVIARVKRSDGAFGNPIGELEGFKIGGANCIYQFLRPLPVVNCIHPAEKSADESLGQLAQIDLLHAAKLCEGSIRGGAQAYWNEIEG